MIPALVGAAANLGVPVVPGDTGWVFAGTGANSGSGRSWNTPTRIVSDNSSYAICPLNSYETGKILVATQFDFSAIPVGATISQIELRAEMGNAGYTTCNFKVNFAGSDGSSNVTIPFSDTIRTRSADIGADPMWGIAPTRAQVQASTFGMQIYNVDNASWSPDTPRVDYMQMKIHWT